MFCPITKKECYEDCAWMVLDHQNTYACAIQIICDMANEIIEKESEDE